ncbi:hypothetical protein [Salinicoccus sp. Marseille-QA3877]
MSNVQGFSRDQVSFQFISLDEMIDTENPVRAIDAFVGSLCLSEMQRSLNIKEITLGSNLIIEKIY